MHVPSIVKCIIKITSWIGTNCWYFCKGQIHSQNWFAHMRWKEVLPGERARPVSKGLRPEHVSSGVRSVCMRISSCFQLLRISCMGCFLCFFTLHLLPALLRSSAITPPPCHMCSSQDCEPTWFTVLCWWVCSSSYRCKDGSNTLTSHKMGNFSAVSFLNLWKIVTSAACLSIVWQATCRVSRKVTAEVR